MNEKVLEINDLHISFSVHAGKVQAIRGINLEIHENEIVALVGESGSGKSVTAKSIIGLLPRSNTEITQGSIILDGIDVTHFSEKEYEKVRGSKVAMIFQDPMTSLNPVISVGKQILEAVLLHQDLDKHAAEAKALELISLVGIQNPESMYKQYPHQLSGGMRQRIVIAIALACEPKLLIADEPTTALDVTIQAQILELIKSLQERLGFAVLFITHDLGVVANISDYVAVMYAGKIVEKGTTEDVFYDSQHPYTWGLLSSMPDLEASESKKLYSIPGTPPNLLNPPKGDAFAARNEYAMKIDYEIEPPMFKISSTHEAATWLLHPQAPKVEKPKIIDERIARYQKRRGE